MPAKQRHCQFCGRPLGRVDKDGAVQQHCGNPSCDWCMPCVKKRQTEAKGEAAPGA